MSTGQTATLEETGVQVKARHEMYPGFCIVFDDDEVERDASGYFIAPDYLAGTHPREYACGDDELIIRMPADTRDA